MNKSELLETISATLGRTKAEALAALCADNKLQVSHLLDLAFDHQREVAFRAAWILEFVVMNHPEAFKPMVNQFIGRYPDQGNHSSQRHFTKIMIRLTDPKYPARWQMSSKDSLEPIIERTFEWLIDPETPVAVKVNCMDILFNLRDRLPWVGDELQSQVVFLLRNGSAALQSRGKAVLKKLKKQRAA